MSCSAGRSGSGLGDPCPSFLSMDLGNLVGTKLFPHAWETKDAISVVRSPSCPRCAAPHLAYPFDFFCVTRVWLSPLVVLDLSLKHQGTISGCFPSEVPLRPCWHELVPQNSGAEKTLTWGQGLSARHLQSWSLLLSSFCLECFSCLSPTIPTAILSHGP